MKKIKCKYCNRIVPYKKHLTKNGCVWCDAQYHEKEKKK